MGGQVFCRVLADAVGCALLQGVSAKMRRASSIFSVALAMMVIVSGACASGIVVEGGRTLSPEAVTAIIGGRAEGLTTPDAIDRAVKALMATGHFEDVQIDRRDGGLVVRVVEHPLAASVGVEGHAALERSKLVEVVQLKAGARVTRAKLGADARRLQELYRKQGRLATTVVAKSEPRADGRVDVAFVIAEAAVSRIDRIDFVGNRAFSARQLRDVISTSESGWFDILKTAAFYEPERIDSDRELIRRHYINNGFPDAVVTGADAVPNASGTGYAIVFTVAEGAEGQFGAASVESVLPGALPVSVAAAVKLRGGHRYSREDVDKTTEVIAETLAKEGQPFVRVTPVHRVRDGGAIDVVFRVEAAPPLYVERIDIVGNTRTKDHVVRRALRLTEGDPVNAFLIERARARVQATGFFKKVAVKPTRGSAPDRAHLTLEVVEDETGTFGVGGGYSSVEGLVGDVGWTERNLFGNGQTLRFKVAGSASRLQADVGFTEPNFLDSNVAAGFDLFYKDIDFTKQASYMSRRVGGTARLGFPIDEQWSTGVNYTFARNTLYNVGSNASAAIREAVPGYPANSASTYDTSSVGHSVTFDGRDNKRRPSTGVYYTLAQDLAGAGGDVRFIRNTGEGRAYYAVADGVTAMGRVVGGQIVGWGGQDVRLLDLFYKGGETVRGFAPAGFGPRDLMSVNRDALGGRTYFATTAELLFEIPGIPKETGLRGAVFADAGSLWGVNKTAAGLPGATGRTLALRASAGVGLAWESPLGPLRVDYAIPLVKQTHDKTQPLSFGLMPF
jgi:outer membrane protein insertion porin family